MYNTFKELLDQLHKEDTTLLCSLIEKINKENLADHQASNVFKALTEKEVSNFTDAQLLLLEVLKVKGGYTLRFYPGYNKPSTPMTAAMGKAPSSLIKFSTWDTDYSGVTTDDFKFLSTYVKNKWKKDNPSQTTSKRKQRGKGFTFSMDEFSLSLFKNTVKPFLRTEAKQLVMRVNEAFEKNTTSTNTVSIRNRFYRLILDNTEVHTKAMLAKIQTTLMKNNNEWYTPKPDEAIAVSVSRWSNSDLQAFTSTQSNDCYSDDVTLVSDGKLLNDQRVASRMITAASIMTSMYTRTNSEVYMDLAKRFLSRVGSTSEAASTLKASALLYDLIKETEDADTRTVTSMDS